MIYSFCQGLGKVNRTEFMGSLIGCVVGDIVNDAVDVEETILLIDIDPEHDIVLGVKVIPVGVYEWITVFDASKTLS